MAFPQCARHWMALNICISHHFQPTFLREGGGIWWACTTKIHASRYPQECQRSTIPSSLLMNGGQPSTTKMLVLPGINAFILRRYQHGLKSFQVFWFSLRVFGFSLPAVSQGVTAPPKHAFVRAPPASGQGLLSKQEPVCRPFQPR